MKRTAVSLLLSCACLLTGCIFDADGPGADVRPGDPVPEFVVQLEDGSVLRSEDLAAGPALLLFFHTSCPDCRRTLPIVQQAYEDYPGVRFVAVSRAEPAAEVRAWWDANGITIPFSAQPDRSVYSLFASSGIPRIYLIETGGTVAARFDDDPCPGYADLAAALDALR